MLCIYLINLNYRVHSTCTSHALYCIYLINLDYRGRIYANMDELYTEVAADEEDPYGYGDESIYDSICYYQAPVSSLNVCLSLSSHYAVSCI